MFITFFIFSKLLFEAFFFFVFSYSYKISRMNWKNHGQIFIESHKVEQLVMKMEATFPTETRNLRRNRNIRSLTWDFVTTAYRQAEEAKLVAASSAGSTLAVRSGSVRKSRSHWFFKKRHLYHRSCGHSHDRSCGRLRNHPCPRSRSHLRSHDRSQSCDQSLDRRRFRSRSQDHYSRYRRLLHHAIVAWRGFWRLHIKGT